MKVNEKEIMIETMQRCSLADFTLEASSVVNTAGCSNRFAFNVHSTFATLIHVRLRILVDDEIIIENGNDFDDGHVVVTM